MTLAAWIDAYRRAWESNDPADVRALFTEDADYYPEPFTPPYRGVDAIVAKWLERRDEPGSATFEWSPLTETPELGIAQGSTVYPHVVYSNLWVIRFAPDGRAREFTEWWMDQSAPS